MVGGDLGVCGSEGTSMRGELVGWLIKTQFHFS